MGKLIWVLLCLIKLTLSEETYQNSSHICEKCTCLDNDSFLLDCSNQNIQHALANWPPHNKSLVATFSYNNIITLERLPFTNRTAKLIFDHCNIQYLDVGVFSNIKYVEYIDLSYNLLTTEQISGEDFKGPYDNKQYREIAVKHLNLAYNQIHSLPQKFFESMPYLEELNLEGNDFKVLDPLTQVALGSLQHIKVLNLANNELTELESSIMRNLHTLIELDLSSNELDFVPTTLNYISKNLKVLKLNDNYIFKLDGQSFLGLNLTEIHLNNLPRLKLIEANTFATQKSLKRLYVSNNLNLRAIDKEAFADNQILDELDLSNNSLTSIDFGLNWSKLKVLRIDSNMLECTCALYNITKALSESITRTLESPVCFYDVEDTIQRVDHLEEGICSGKPPVHITKIMKHFNTIRLAFILVSSVLITSMGVLVAIAVLRYKKRVTLRNYPFMAQVNYYPIINTQHI
ncbi:unnamed protein product [Phyllotreta striolata]|uniref:Uncharacterized protein n=1 Tax=Phyllotreta striolata TaxID=444603 RepID=A0A9N9TW77_PHYSR|nr:unnamed protein product [Phyllotreta striolata]